MSSPKASRFYRRDLAYVHHAGHGDLARQAAATLIGELRESGVTAGTIVDLGCGSGILAARLCESGLDAVGIDLSAGMIELARKRAPGAAFRVGSFVGVDLPTCVAVTAIGEVLNYAADPGNDGRSRRELFQRVHDALVPGGLLLFDVAGPDRSAASSPQRTFSQGSDWAVLAETTVDAARKRLTRRITTFRQIGSLYRRDSEQHELALIETSDIVAALQSSGFDVRVRRRYGDLPLPAGLTAFIGRRL